MDPVHNQHQVHKYYKYLKKKWFCFRCEERWNIKILLEVLQYSHCGLRSQFEFSQQYVERFWPSGIHVEWVRLLYINGNTQPLTSKILFYFILIS